MKRKSFGSDNHSGVHPEIISSINAANEGDCIAYGDDKYTEDAVKSFKKIFGNDIDVYFMLTGTGANTVSISSVMRSYNAVIAAETSHIHVDECGSIENFSGCKIKWVKTEDGKLTPDNISHYFHGRGDEHHVQPKVISITQGTELGTVYTKSEVRELADFAHEKGLLLHMDGARLSNAVVSLNCSFGEITAECGVDFLSFGGTKNGMMVGDAVVFFNQKLSEEYKYFRKQGMQLISKMRFISAQFSAYFKNDLWKANAMKANRMASLLAEKVSEIPEIEIVYPVQANAVFVKIPEEFIVPLQKEYFFYVWDEQKSIVRWMTSFNTKEKNIKDFVAKIKEIVI